MKRKGKEKGKERERERKRKTKRKTVVVVVDVLAGLAAFWFLVFFWTGLKVKFSETEPKKSGFGDEKDWLYLGVVYYSFRKK